MGIDAMPLMLALLAIVGLIGLLQVGLAFQAYQTGTANGSNRGNFGDVVFRFGAAAVFGICLAFTLSAGPEPRWLLALLPGVLTVKWLLTAILSYLLMRKLAR